MERMIGRGLVWAEGSEHTRQRLTVAPHFTAARVKDMEISVQDSIETFINRFQKHVISDPAFSPIEGRRVNVLTWLTWPTLDIIGKVAMGYDFRCGESVGARGIHQAWKEFTNAGMALPGFFVPLIIRAFPWIVELPLGVIQAQGTVKTILKGISRTIVDEIKQTGEDDVRSRNDLLGKLIQDTDANNDEDVDLMLDQVSSQNVYIFSDLTS